MVHHGGLAAEHGVGEGMALADGDRRQVGPVGDVADRVDGRDQGLRIGVDDDRAGIVGGDARLVEAETGHVGAPPGRHQDLVDDPHRAVGQGRRDAVGRPLETPDGLAQHEVDAPGRIGRAQGVANILVEAAQELLAAMEQRRLAAEAVEDSREFHRDVAAADHEDAPRAAPSDGTPRSR